MDQRGSRVESLSMFDFINWLGCQYEEDLLVFCLEVYLYTSYVLRAVINKKCEQWKGVPNSLDALLFKAFSRMGTREDELFIRWNSRRKDQ